MTLSINERGIDVGVSISPEDILEIRLAGNISSDEHEEDLVALSNETKKLILELKGRKWNNASCIVDISDLGSFDEGSVEILSALAGWSESTTIKTAVIGGSRFSRMALRTVVIVSGRTNLKSFETRALALAWFGEKDASSN